MIKLYDAEKLSYEQIFAREKDDETAVENTVRGIIADVRERGDAALYEYAKRFDGAEINALEVKKEEIEAAVKAVGSFADVLREAAENIRLFHEKQKISDFEVKNLAGARVGQRVLPLNRVGIYVPGGTACYPSTVLMNAIPAVIAGVSEIVMITPPGRDGTVNAGILAAAAVAGVTRVFKSGGAQAIAALAYGTESVPAVDKIVGPGNIFVATAKRQVFGTVDIDMIAGPSEILVVADKGSNPSHVAADLLSQAEHDKRASAILVTDSINLAKSVQLEIERQLELLPRRAIAAESIENNGKILLVKSVDEAIALSNRIAPEHLELAVSDAEERLSSVKNAGSVFLGYYTPEAVGDYFAGSNHTLPTSGTARFSSPLGVLDFVKTTQYISYEKAELLRVWDKVEDFAEREGLTAHARSVSIRFEGGKNE